MHRRPAARALLALALLSTNFAAPARAQQPSATPTPAAQAPVSQAVPADAIERIKDEGINRSQAMQTLSYLTDVIGPRLTGSPALKRANNWTRDKLAEWGLQNAHLEAWGPFGRGWTLKRFSAEVTAPQAFPLTAYPRAWSPGFDAPLNAEVVLVEAEDEEQLQKYRGQLRGRIVLAGAMRELKPRFEANATRLTDKQLLDLANAPDPALTPRRPQPQPNAEQVARFRFAERRNQFYAEEGAALIVVSSPAGDGGTLQFVQSAVVPLAPDTPPNRRVSPWDLSAPKVIPQIALSNDHYNRLVRMIRQGEKPSMSVNLQVEFDSSDPMAYNTIAEIPGSDLKDEIVMLGAHLDSWHTATGATDNAAGVSIMMEAVRILRATGLQPRRTIRIALWSGEEQGLLGSRAYVREHFGPLPATTPATAAPRFKPEYDKHNVYFNVDSGTGAIRGVYLQGNEALRPIFRQWLAPFRELKIGQNTYSAQTITLANAGGSDFLAFDAVGLLGLDFLQDDIEYETRTWHSNQDTYDRVIAEDVKEAAIIVAAFVYNAAMSDQKLPRKPFTAPTR
jgi:hypothetical protein